MGTEREQIQVDRVIDLLTLLGCPNPRRGEGTSLFEARKNGPSPLTPDIVAGDFFGPEDPRSFFIDVIAPSGDYFVNPLAGARETSAFFTEQIDTRGTFSMADLPKQFATPLIAPIGKKATKYAKRRSDSPLFGVIAYFDQREKVGGAVMSSVFYADAVNAHFGGIDADQIRHGHSVQPSENNSLVVNEVCWDLPLAFLMQATLVWSREKQRIEVTAFPNRHIRLTGLDNPVIEWVTRLGGEQVQG